LDNYRSKPPFNRFDPATLEAYVEHGFVDLPDATVTLACRREDEASVFEGARDSGGLTALSEVDRPVVVFGGEDGKDPLSRVAELVALRLRHGRYRRLEGLDHFGPMCDPDRVAHEAASALLGDARGSHSGVAPSR
jgi:hypothetical protein